MSSNQDKSSSSIAISHFAMKLDLAIIPNSFPDFHVIKNVLLNKDEHISCYLYIGIKSFKSDYMIETKLEFSENINFIALKILLKLYYFTDEIELLPKKSNSNRYIYEAYCLISNKLITQAQCHDNGGYYNVGAFRFNEIIFLCSIDKSNHFKKISETLQYSLKSKEFSDLIIKVGTKKFDVHKLIICSKSNVFKRMIQTDMLEKRSSLVDLKDTIKIETFEEILNFIYQGCCDLSKDVHEIFAFAHQYEIEDLQILCKKYMLSNVSKLDKIKTTKLITVGNYHLYALKTAFEKYINENEKDVVKDEIYVNHLVDNMTCKNVHHIFRLGMVYKLKKIDKIKEFIVLNLKEIMKNNKDFAKLVKSKPDYMFDILSTMTVNKFRISLNDE